MLGRVKDTFHGMLQLFQAFCRSSLSFLAFSLVVSGDLGAREESPEKWFSDGQRALERLKTREQNNGPAKNVILFIGDGMGISTITAARILEGQQVGEPGEENSLSFEQLPYSALSKTYSVNQQTADSAPTMTAIVTGVKTGDAMLSVNQYAIRGDHRSSASNELTTILQLAKRTGKSVGIVTTTRITHATPAACYAHSPERDWECDAEMSASAREDGFSDIARQLIEFNENGGIDVILGGGRLKFLPKSKQDPEYGDLHGERRDERDLIEEWKQRTGGTFVWNKAQFEQVSGALNTPLLGLFEPSHMKYEYDRPTDPAGEPSLTEMALKAVELLGRNTNGYFLMIEGGRIDHGHHEGNAFRALTETIELSRTVDAVRKRVGLDETLLIVTADHSHTLTIGGYPKRGNDILGLVESVNEHDSDGLQRSTDLLGKHYTTLSYANGPGYVGASDKQAEGVKTFPHKPKTFVEAKRGRPSLKEVDCSHPNFLQEALSPRSMETHGGEDVAIFAGGPKAHLFGGVLEQNVIFHIMVEAMGMPVDLIREPPYPTRLRTAPKATLHFGKFSVRRRSKWASTLKG